MPESSQIVFDYRELAGILVKQQGIHTGHWGIFVRFGLGAANMDTPEAGMLPTAIVPLREVGIQKFSEPNSLTVDAAKVNPAKGRANAGPKKRPAGRKRAR